MKRDHRLRIIAYLTITFWAVIFLQHLSRKIRPITSSPISAPCWASPIA